MRASLILLALAACSVPEKHNPVAGDAGVDGTVPIDATEDEKAPETSITSGPPEFSNAGSSTFEFTADEPATFECAFDGETPVTCASPYTRSLGNGSHAFMVRAIDTAGNTDDTPAEQLWTIDTAAPETSLTQRPPAADNSVMVTFAFESNEDNVAFECSLDGTSYAACESRDTFGPINDGPHSFAVRAKDRAGNTDSSPAVYAWTVDTSTPDTQLLSGPTGAVGTTSASFTFVSPDAGSGATFQCSLDGGAFSTCSSPRNYSNLGEGNHTFAVKVRDAVGNTDPTPATRQWSVDLAAPNTTILSGPIGVVAMASASFTFSSNEQDVTFACSLDNAAFAACSSPQNFSALSQGQHTFAVRATDTAGHDDASPATRMWTVDTVAPDVTITAGPANGATVGPYVSIAFSASDGTIECSLDSAAFAPCTSPMDWNLKAGSHDFRVRATDAAGNSETATRMWTIACVAPDSAGAAGLLHLDDGGQTMTNAVAGGASATLGDDATVEPTDPARVAGRFASALSFTSTEGDHVAWPAALGPLGATTIELWAKPESAGGTRELFATGDGRVVVRVVAVSPTTVRFTFTVLEADNTAHVVNSAVVAANTWHHVLASIQDPVARLWVDGVETEATGVSLGMAPAFDAITLGGTGATAYEGILDEVWLAPTAITADDAARARFCPP